MRRASPDTRRSEVIFSPVLHEKTGPGQRFLEQKLGLHRSPI